MQIEKLEKSVFELERQLGAIRKIAVGLSTLTNMDELVREALDLSLDLVGSDAGSILLYRPDKERLVFEYVVGAKAGEIIGMELRLDQGLAGQVFQSGESRIIEDVNKESAYLRDVSEKVGYVTTNMVVVPLKSPSGEPIGVIEVLNKRYEPFDSDDVNLIEILAAQIAVAIETARLHEQARLAAVVRLIGNISHDIKNMITPALSGAQTLKMISDDCFGIFDQSFGSAVTASNDVQPLIKAFGELKELYPEITDMIIDSCNVVRERMSEVSTAVKGVVSKPSFEPTDMISLSHRVGSMLSASAQRKGVTLSIEPGGEMPLAVVDGKQMFNAVYNLIFNAIDACDDGDEVKFRVACQSGTDGPTGTCIVLECEDSGPGIPENVLRKLFTDDAISTKPMGTGLGTKIIKNVVDAHGGTVEVESEEGVGTIIRCVIPSQNGGPC